jgi:hypothetical protein
MGMSDVFDDLVGDWDDKDDRSDLHFPELLELSLHVSSDSNDGRYSGKSFKNPVVSEYNSFFILQNVLSRLLYINNYFNVKIVKQFFLFTTIKASFIIELVNLFSY